MLRFAKVKKGYKMNKSIIRLLAICLLTAFTEGCVHTTFEKTADGFSVNRRAFLYPFKTGGFEFDPATGLITVLDYNTDGGNDNLKTAIEAGVAAGVKAAKAGL